MDYPIIKYPRTPHLAGSRLQPGDEDLSQVPFSCPAGRRPTRARCAQRSAAATSSTASGSTPSTAYITTRCPTTSLSSTSSTARRANFSTQGGAGS